MRNETRKLYTAMLAQLASINGVADVTEKFTVNPTVQQTLEGHVQESSEFLRRINMIGVTEQQGQKVGCILTQMRRKKRAVWRRGHGNPPFRMRAAGSWRRRAGSNCT